MDTHEKFIFKTKEQKESDYLKNYQHFFVYFAEYLPNYVFHNINKFKHLYSNDSYIVRNGLTEALKHVILWLSKKMRSEENYVNDFKK